jgi:O-antigen ligase
LKNKNNRYYILAIAIGFGIGLKVIPDLIVLLGYLAIIVFALISYIKSRPERFIALFILAAYLEPYSRTYLVLAPYLTLQYLIILIAVYTLISKKFRSKYQYEGLFYFGLFFLVELLNSFRFIDLRFATGVLTHTASMLSFLYVGSKLSFDRKVTEYFLEIIFISSLLLAAIISVVYLKGDIQWTAASNSETSGGMGPVQISFYLAIGAFAGLYSAFLSRGIARVIYSILSAAIIIIMILTFSRGGLYMLGLMIAVAFFSQKEKKYIFLIIPLGIIIYWGVGFVAKVTEGKIIDRYEQEGTSSRDLLIAYGWEMFEENPYIGIGTANYYFEVKKSKYLGSISGAHNEIIRALAEHGFIGGVLWILFFIISILQWRNKKGFYKQISMVLFLVFLASTFHNGLKLALQPMILLIAVASRPSPKFYLNKSNKEQNSLNRRVS